MDNFACSSSLTQCSCGSHEATFVESRRAHLEAYLRALIRAPRLLARCTALKRFLRVAQLPSPDRFFAEQFDFERNRQVYTMVYEPVDISGMEPSGRLCIPNFNNFDDGDEEDGEDDVEPKDSASERLSWVEERFSNCAARKASVCSLGDEEHSTFVEDRLSLLFKSALMDGMGRECSARISHSSFSMGGAISVRLSADFSKLDLDLVDIQAELPPSRRGLSALPEDCCRSDCESVESVVDTDSASSGSGSEGEGEGEWGLKQNLGMLQSTRTSSFDS